MKRTIISFIKTSFYAVFLCLSMSYCTKTEESTEIKFNVEVDEIKAYSSRITITHNGTNRDLYYGKLYEGDGVDIEEKIDEILNLYQDGQLSGDLFSQRKKVFVLPGLSPEKTYTYLVFGIDEEGMLRGIPGKQVFTTVASDFQAVENQNWSVSYFGQAFHNHGYYSKFKVVVTGDVEERYFLATYPLSIHAQYETEESFITFAIEQFNKNNIENDPNFWIESSGVVTQSYVFYRYHDEDDYIAYAIGVNADGSPTGHYAKSDSFHIDKYPMTQGYANLMGDWTITDKDGKTYYVFFSEGQVNKSAEMIGWGNYLFPIIVDFDQTNNTLYFNEQLSDANATVTFDGEPVSGSLYMRGWYLNLSEQTEQVKNIDVLAKGVYSSGNRYSFESMFSVTFGNGSTAQTLGIAYELHPKGVSSFYRFSKMEFPFTMTKP